MMSNRARNEIERLRAERREERKRYLKMSEELHEMLDRFSSNKGEHMIDWDVLASTIIGDIYYVNDKVSFIPVDLNENELKFVTVICPGGSFGEHEHNIDEYCKVLKGQLIEPLQNFHVTEVGEMYKYKSNVRHAPKGSDKEVTILWVIFKRNLDDQL